MTRYLINVIVFLIISLGITYFFSKKMPKIYHLIINLVRYITSNTHLIGNILTFIIWCYIAQDWLRNDESPALFLILILLIIGYPVITLIIHFMMIIVNIIGNLFLSIAENYDNSNSSYNNYQNEDFYGYSGYDNYYDGYGNHNNNYYSNYNSNNNYSYNNYEQDYHQGHQNNNYHEYYNSYGSKNYNNSNSNNSNNKSYNQNQNNTNNNSNSNNYRQNNSSNSYEDALKFYGLKIPFSEKDLKDKRKEFMKKYHPDNGGTEEDAKKVNTYYEILKKYAS